MLECERLEDSTSIDVKNLILWNWWLCLLSQICDQRSTLSPVLWAMTVALALSTFSQVWWFSICEWWAVDSQWLWIWERLVLLKFDQYWDGLPVCRPVFRLIWSSRSTSVHGQVPLFSYFYKLLHVKYGEIPVLRITVSFSVFYLSLCCMERAEWRAEQQQKECHYWNNQLFFISLYCK